MNQHLTEAMEVEIQVTGSEFSGALSGTRRQLTSANVRDENTFGQPDVVKASLQKPISVKGNSFVHQLAPHSVEALLLRKAQAICAALAGTARSYPVRQTLEVGTQGGARPGIKPMPVLS